MRANNVCDIAIIQYMAKARQIWRVQRLEIISIIKLILERWVTYLPGIRSVHLHVWSVDQPALRQGHTQILRE